ncbi:hypothetical protein Naga_100232g5 [Nannochloropsis gaditana]|uniref:Uncharacterized protein n=1 Tax=Nannochloropsis gaditana TaxID=72520 RepID=W7TY20_9STRA|nr:hypothetical protein Naga_100232g5 [Nannochloropsis gaditana]
MPREKVGPGAFLITAIQRASALGEDSGRSGHPLARGFPFDPKQGIIQPSVKLSLCTEPNHTLLIQRLGRNCALCLRIA